MNEHENREIVFFGRITAGITHEMKNVLAIIKESSGLMEDLMQLSRDSAFPHSERMMRALTTIKEQVQRGVDLTAHLNRFAHEPDEDIKSVDLAGQVEHLIALSQRFARLRNVILKIEPPDPPLHIETRSVQLQMLLFAGIECCLHLLEKGGEIRLRPLEQDGKIRIHILCRREDLDEAVFTEFSGRYEKWPALLKLAEILGGSIEPDGSVRGISIQLPKKIPV
jgi:C4-dicarboxylate-specific signal transduction histidine kinase